MPTLNWIGKDKVINHHNEVPFRTLEKRYHFGEDDGNMVIHGDNLEALKALLPRYEGEVKCIYIDPPYNTGEEGWVYSDRLSAPEIKNWLQSVVGKEGEDLSRHDKWLCMMYPRLQLLQELLSDDGAIFISIDDNELYNLKLICDEIFSSHNYVSTFVWEKRLNRENRKEVSSRHDYILCYAKNKKEKQRTLKLMKMSGEALKRYQNPDNDPRGPWKSDPVTAQAGHATKNQFYTLVTPNGKKHTLPAGRCWLYTKEKMENEIAEGRIWLGKDGNNTPRKKTYLYEKDRGLTPESILFAQDVSTNELAKNELKGIFPETVPFTTPKPHQLVEVLLRLITDKNSLILDSFAGSGTTAHAVLNMNKADGGNRKFILIEMMDYAEDITAERVRRVIDGYGKGKKAVKGTGGGFGYYELGDRLFLEDGNINPKIDTEKIREYLWFSETRKSYVTPENSEPFLLGIWNDIAYYLFYDGKEAMALDIDTLAEIQTRAGAYVIYAETCMLSDRMLLKYNMTFKKFPRDIVRI